MTNDTQKAREWLEKSYPGTCKNPDHKDWDCKISIKGKESEVLESYAAHVTAQKDAEIAKWRTRAKKFLAACRDADFECFAQALRAACHKDEIKRLRAQAEKDKAEIESLRSDNAQLQYALERSEYSIVEKEV